MTILRRALPALLCLGLVLHGRPAAAADLRPIVVGAARSAVIPRYEALAEATARQAKGWSAFCAAPSAEGFRPLDGLFREAADAWSGVEFVRYGPVLDENRIERMAHWPERQNAVGRALTTLLGRTGAADLTSEQFAKTSVAGQGLTALERILFEGGTGAAVEVPFLDASPKAERRCAVGQAIAESLARNAAAIAEGWRKPDGALAALETGDADFVREGATRIATELLAFLELIGDQKLGAPMGKGDADSARPTLAEGWRSGRSLRAIQANLAGIEALARALVDPQSDEGNSALAGLAVATSVAGDLQGSVGEMAADPDRRGGLVLLRNAAAGARELLGGGLTQSLDVMIGFNSGDGD